jgi:hypothetical protein
VDVERQREEVDRNYDAFTRVLGSILEEHRDQLALMRVAGSSAITPRLWKRCGRRPNCFPTASSRFRR